MDTKKQKKTIIIQRFSILDFNIWILKKKKKKKNLFSNEKISTVFPLARNWLQHTIKLHSAINYLMETGHIFFIFHLFCILSKKFIFFQTSLDKVENVTENHGGIWICYVIQEDFGFKWATNWFDLEGKPFKAFFIFSFI